MKEQTTSIDSTDQARNKTFQLTE